LVEKVRVQCRSAPKQHIMENQLTWVIGRGSK
jgi:hypothetical protein